MGEDTATWPSIPGTLFADYHARAGTRVRAIRCTPATLDDLRHAVEVLVLDAPGGTLVSAPEGASAAGPASFSTTEDDRGDAERASGRTGPDPGVRLLQAPDGHPLADEWFAVATASTFTALVVAHPLADASAPAADQLAVLWSFDPDVVAPVLRRLEDVNPRPAPPPHRSRHRGGARMLPPAAERYGPSL